MTTTERVMVSGDVEVEVECDWSFERNPFDKEAPHYGGEDDGWHLDSWRVTNGVPLNPKQEIELDDELHRQGPNA